MAFGNKVWASRVLVTAGMLLFVGPSAGERAETCLPARPSPLSAGNAQRCLQCGDCHRRTSSFLILVLPLASFPTVRTGSSWGSKPDAEVMFTTSLEADFAYSETHKSYQSVPSESQSQGFSVLCGEMMVLTGI